MERLIGEYLGVPDRSRKDQSLSHPSIHSFGYCFTNLSDSVTQALTETGEAAKYDPPRRQVKGQTVFVARDQLGSHAVLNVGPSTFLQFIIELQFATPS